MALQTHGPGWEQVDPNATTSSLTLTLTPKTHLQQKISFRNLVLRQPRCFTVVLLRRRTHSVTTVQGDWGQTRGDEAERRQRKESLRASVRHPQVPRPKLPLSRTLSSTPSETRSVDDARSRPPSPPTHPQRPCPPLLPTPYQLVLPSCLHPAREFPFPPV